MKPHKQLILPADGDLEGRAAPFERPLHGLGDAIGALAVLLVVLHALHRFSDAPAVVGFSALHDARRGEARLGVPGLDAGHFHAEPSHLAVEREGEIENARLGRRITGLEGDGQLPRHRADVYKVSLGFFKVFDGDGGNLHERGEVGIEDSLDVLGRGVFHRTRNAHARVVDDGVDAPLAFKHGRKDIFDGGKVGDVGLKALEALARKGAAGNAVHMAPDAREPLRRRKPDAARGAGYHHNLVQCAFHVIKYYNIMILRKQGFDIDFFTRRKFEMAYENKKAAIFLSRPQNFTVIAHKKRK